MSKPSPTQSFMLDLTENLNTLQLVESPKTTQVAKPSQSRVRTGSKGRVLFPVDPEPEKHNWIEKEVYALVLFLMLHTDGKSWVVHKEMKFWTDAGIFVQRYSGTAHCRSGSSCRSRVTKILIKQFISPAEAEKHYIALLAANTVVAIGSTTAVSTTTTSVQRSTMTTSVQRLTTTTTSVQHLTTTTSVQHLTTTPVHHLSSTTPVQHLCTTIPVQHLTTTTPVQHLAMTAPVLHLTTTTPVRCSSMTIPVQHLTTTTPVQHLTTTTSVQHLSTTIPFQHLTTTPVHHFPETVTMPVQLKPATSSGFCSPSIPKEQSKIEHVLSVCWLSLKSLPAPEQLKVLSTLFDMFLQSSTTLHKAPNFIEYSVKGMYHLADCSRSNIIYLLTKSLGTLRPDKSDSVFPAKRMPMGLIEHCINFFNAPTIQQVHCPPDYRSWLETMYVLFGTKWLKIYSGPMWSHESAEQIDVAPVHNNYDPVKAFVNVPALSERTIRRDIAASDFTTGPEIQVAILKKLDTNSRWWIKGDGTDVVKGLWESVSGEWAGDVDLNDGVLQHKYEQHQSKVNWATTIGLPGDNIEQVKDELIKAKDTVTVEIEFTSDELQKANNTYEEKLAANHNTKDQTMFSLCWDIEELKNINNGFREVYRELSSCINLCSRELFLERNVPEKLTIIRTKLTELLKRASHYRRTPATHVFVLMVSSETRKNKPYALPVQCLPYSGLKESDLRQLISSLCRQMTLLGLKPSGFVSDGEFNFLRSKGNTRPLSILQVRSNVRNIYSRMGLRKMLAMITPKVELSDGTIQAELDTGCIPQSVLREIWSMRRQGISFEDIVERLRPRTVPSGYTYHNWTPGQSESFEEQLRSILAQYHYTHAIKAFEAKGVMFRVHMYVPEKHPETHEVFYEREDEAHLIKRIASHTRNGGPDKLKLQRYAEALNDPSSGLTYPAFTGSRKQSVVDAERLFDPKLALFMEKRGYSFEAKYIRTVWNWRRASDERDLSSLQRCRYNYEMLSYILEI